MKYPRISVVTPSFNNAAFLERTISSVVNQGYPDLEYLIFDCGSKDNSREIIRKYAEKHKQIHPVFKSDHGQWDAVNKGFHQASGKLLGFLNADDIYTEGSLFSLGRVYLDHPDRLWYVGQGMVIDSHDKPIYPIISLYKNFLLSLNHRFLLQVVNYLMQPSVFITRKAFLTIGDFLGEGKYIMEYAAWLKLANIQMPVTIPAQLSGFRLSTGMASLNHTQKLLTSDYNIVCGMTNNPMILALHRLHNCARIKLAKA